MVAVGFIICAIFAVVIGRTLFVLGRIWWERSMPPYRVIYDSKKDPNLKK